MKKKLCTHDEMLSAQTDRLSKDHALLRLAEELGRIVGKFLADEMTKSSKGTSSVSRDLKKN